jgi:hypothetical protein
MPEAGLFEEGSTRRTRTPARLAFNERAECTGFYFFLIHVTDLPSFLSGVRSVLRSLFRVDCHQKVPVRMNILGNGYQAGEFARVGGTSQSSFVKNQLNEVYSCLN